MGSSAPLLASFALIASLGLLLLSTRQWHLWVRLPIWIGGFLLLGFSAFLTFGDPLHAGVARIIGDAFGSGGDSAAATTIGSNWDAVAIALVPMLDVFLVATLLLALVAVLAMTPGETIERIVRPIMIAVGGAIIGGVLAISISALGIGGGPERRAYAAILSDSDVIDGDTIRVGGVSLRLWGVDAPEMGQLCGPNNDNCGELARAELWDIVRDRLIVCRTPEDRAPNEPLVESFGRPIVTCMARKVGGRSSASGDAVQAIEPAALRDEDDIAQLMVSHGWADLYYDNGRARSSYQADLAAGRANPHGIWSRCMLSPRAWRDSRARDQFKAGAYRQVRDRLLNPEACGPAARPQQQRPRSTEPELTRP